MGSRAEKDVRNVYATRSGPARLVPVSHRAAPALFARSCVCAFGVVWSLGAHAQAPQLAPERGDVARADVARADVARGDVARADVAPVPAAPVVWDPAWPKFRIGEWIAAGAGLAALLSSRMLAVPNAHWQGGIGFDEAARDALRLHTPSARRWARDGSDIGITINESWPFFDALVVAGWYRDSPQVGVQQALISAEVLSVTAGVQGLVSLFASRERPYGRECGGELAEQTRDCGARDRYYSFYSGHSSQSFAAAAVNCMHHAYVPLYGGGAADSWACVGSFGVAATTALLRVATDVHYVSDVLVGALIGTTTGLMLPWALHYRHGSGTQLRGSTNELDRPKLELSVRPAFGADFNGLYGVLVF